jgi:hypothetical protein
MKILAKFAFVLLVGAAVLFIRVPKAYAQGCDAECLACFDNCGDFFDQCYNECQGNTECVEDYCYPQYESCTAPCFSE